MAAPTSTAVQAAITIQPCAGQLPPPNAVLPAWTSQYDGMDFMTSNSGPECASWNPYTPPTSANRMTTPPMAGVSASTDSRYPSTMPRAMNGVSPTSSSPPSSSHCAASSRTPSDTPARNTSTTLGSAIR